MAAVRRVRNRPANSQFTDWCYTYNDIPQTESGAKDWIDGAVAVLENARREKTIQYYVGQLERGEGGRLHFQLFVQYERRVRGLSINRWPGMLRNHRPHCERRLGTADECEEYHSKEETRVYGPFRGGRLRDVVRGQRTDLERVAERVRQGASARDVASEYPTEFFKYHGGIERAIKLSRTCKALTEPPEVRRLVPRVL